MSNDKQERPVIDVYAKEMVITLLKWIRNDSIANEMFNYHIIKEDGKIVTEEEIIELFRTNHNITSKKYPIGYSILTNTEN